MKSFYFVYNDDTEEEAAKELFIYLSKKYKKVSFLKLFAKSSFSDFYKSISTYANDGVICEKYQSLNSYVDDNIAFIKKAISVHNELTSKNDFVVVLGCDDFNIDLKLAKELNTNIVISNNEDSLIRKKIAEKKSFEPVIFSGDFNAIDTLKKTDFISPNVFEMSLVAKAKLNKKTIVLPESHDERILQATQILMEEDCVDLILLGDIGEVTKLANEKNINIEGIRIINNENSQYLEEFTNYIYEARKSKGVSFEDAQKMAKDRNYFGTMLVQLGYADAMVSGAACSTADTIRPALQLVKTKKGISSVSGLFFMCLEDKVLIFADCAVNTNPTAQDLAQIAKVTSDTAKSFGFDPRIAMLSYSTAGSGKGPSVDTIIEATKFAKEYNINVDGPMQFDAAIDKKTAKSKMPDSKVAGNANVFIFPNLDAGNITYKAVQRTANALAIGPILQGLNKVVNDLSRGCLVEDVVNTVLISAIMANEKQ